MVINLNAITPAGAVFEDCLAGDALTAIDGVQGGSVVARATVRRLSESDFDISLCVAGSVTVPCDRCLEPLTIDIDAQATLQAKIAGRDDTTETDDETVITVEAARPEIELKETAVELIAVNIPIRHVHAPGNCDRAMTDILNKYAAARSDEGPDNTARDPRWQSLEGLKQ